MEDFLILSDDNDIDYDYYLYYQYKLRCKERTVYSKTKDELIKWVFLARPDDWDYCFLPHKTSISRQRRLDQPLHTIEDLIEYIRN
jgi:hypothetical protein